MMGLAIDPEFAGQPLHLHLFGLHPRRGQRGRAARRWTVDANFTTLTNRTDIMTGAPVNVDRRARTSLGLSPPVRLGGPALGRHG